MELSWTILTRPPTTFCGFVTVEKNRQFSEYEKFAKKINNGRKTQIASHFIVKLFPCIRVLSAIIPVVDMCIW